MSRRDVAREQIEENLRNYPNYADHISEVGIEREIDGELVGEAQAALSSENLNLTRWNGHPEIQSLILSARIATNAAAAVVWHHLNGGGA